jgi:hypothetical protein
MININALIDQGIIANHLKETPRTYLGASYIGDDCLRKIQYQYLNTIPDKPITAATLRIFDRGHKMEEMVATYLRNAGFELKTHLENGEQIGFVSDDFKGHVDGIIVSGADGLPYPFLWENKALGNKSWNTLQGKTLAVSKPVYAAQIALYQSYMNLTSPALFTAVNSDTMEIYIEWVRFDAELAQKMSDRAVVILNASKYKETLNRITEDRNFYQCNWCNYKQTCWGVKI